MNEERQLFVRKLSCHWKCFYQVSWHTLQTVTTMTVLNIFVFLLLLIVSNYNMWSFILTQMTRHCHVMLSRMMCTFS